MFFNVASAEKECALVKMFDMLKIFLGAGVIMLLLDGAWLTLRQEYHNRLFENIQKSPISARLLPAIGVYILLPVIVYLGAVKGAKSVKDAALRGAITGALVYGFYDLTNYATFQRWTLHMTITDSLWGTFVCSVGAAVGYYLSQ